VHTSTVTVAVLEPPAAAAYQLLEADIEVFTTRDSGPGGQHRNTTDSCVVMRHMPTGLEAKASAKSQHHNRRLARELLEARVAAFYRDAAEADRAGCRRQQLGSGQRGDKVRTYRERDDLATDHRSGTKARLGRVLAGQVELMR